LRPAKGAFVCETCDEAEKALGEIFDKKQFGEAGSQAVIEEKMDGEEASVFVLTDGKNYKLLPVRRTISASVKATKGPNTGGMGGLRAMRACQ